MASHAPHAVEAALRAYFAAAGASADNAAAIARAIVAAEAEDNAICGFFYAPILAAQLRSGRIDGSAVPEIVERADASIVIDAKNGLAQPALELAVRELPAIARARGIALATVRRSTNALALGPFVSALAEDALIALMFVNSPACVAPVGSSRPLFGTNPFALAAPIAGAPPLVIDQSTSAVAKTVILERRERGEPIPEGWAVDEDGRPTTDPNAALNGGAILPNGGVRGGNVALMVEIMASVLSTGAGSVDAGDLEPADGPEIGLGHTLIAIPAGAPGQTARMTRLVELIAAEPGLRLPGRRRAAALARNRAQGLELDEEIAASLGL